MSAALQALGVACAVYATGFLIGAGVFTGLKFGAWLWGPWVTLKVNRPTPRSDR